MCKTLTNNTVCIELSASFASGDNQQFVDWPTNHSIGTFCRHNNNNFGSAASVICSWQCITTTSLIRAANRLQPAAAATTIRRQADQQPLQDEFNFQNPIAYRLFRELLKLWFFCKFISLRLSTYDGVNFFPLLPTSTLIYCHFIRASCVKIESGTNQINKQTAN